ncbi:MAG TPA: orotate phosphoribosyltransferase [bacterium]|nr:orotate phosphoribosyltransferase [bacterium]HQG44241.1 orotate phosphoribosyltransferase [bacterium]HQI47617.1 orotate phosphoribosyltransferase [bacterium]HQJ63610.1 orotate phosphoribosyltransferase [bacterium]
MTNDEALAIFKESGALLEGHFRLTSGLHSPHYFQCAKVLQYPQHAETFCRLIAERFRTDGITVVISPAIGGIVVGQEVARLLGCRAIFAEREEGMMTLRRGFEIKAGERCLAVEDVVTTGGSVKEVIALALSAGAQVIGAAFIVDRSAGRVQFDVPFFAALKMEVVTHQPETCPLCAQGIPVVKPGSRKI